MGKTRLLLLALACCALAAAAAERRDPAVVTLAAELRAAPAAGAPVLATLAAGEKVAVFELRGGRARVEAAAGTGWMSSAKLRIGEPGGEGGAASSGGTSWLRGLTGMLGGSSAQDTSAKVPIGVRGLKKEDLASAQPDPGAVDRLEAWKASLDEGLAHAGAAGLESRHLDYRRPATSAAGPAPGPSN